MNSFICSDCESSIWCGTWCEWKCLVKLDRVRDIERLECEDYKKRKKDFKERPCQCKDCLKNDKLFDEVETEN